MRQYRNVGILVLVLALLTGAWYFVTKQKAPEDKSNPVITIFQTDKANIVEMAIRTNGQDFAFIKGEKDWQAKENSAIRLIQSKVDSLAYECSSVSAEKLVEEKSANLAQYGLVQPSTSVSIRLKDGSQQTFMLGNQTISKASAYFKSKDNDKVYTVYSSKVDSFSAPLESYRERNIVPVTAENITGFSIEGKNRAKIVIQQKPQKQEDQTGALSTWDMILPSAVNGSNDSINQLIQKIPSITVKDFINDRPTDLGQYGLASPNYTLSFTDKDHKTQTLMLGSVTGDAIYLKVAGLESIYTVDAQSVSFKDTDPFDLMEKFAFITNIDSVKKITIDGKGKQYVLDIAKNGDKYDLKINGKPAEESAGKAIYSESIGLLADGIETKPVQGAAEVTCTFSFVNGSPDVKMEYVSRDDRNYDIYKNGKCQFFILKKKLEAMLNKLAAFEADPQKAPTQ